MTNSKAWLHVSEGLVVVGFILSFINFLGAASSLGLPRQSTGLLALALATASFFIARKEPSLLISGLLLGIGVIDTAPSLTFFLSALPKISGAIIGVAIGSWVLVIGIFKTRTTVSAMRKKPVSMKVKNQSHS